jgi:teichoic acid transport system permease protein
VRDDGRLSAPGQLRQGDQVSAEGITTTQLPDQPLAELAAQYDLRPSAAIPPVFAYIKSLWVRRHFILAFATARNIAMYTDARLGQLWQVLTPLLNVAVYYLIFGLLLHTNKGIPDYISFLVVGVFVFNFTQRAFISTSRVMFDSLPLIRALQFPRASMPLAYVMIELEQMFVSMAVLIVIILIRGEPVTWYWLLAIPVLLLQTVFNVGIGLFAARLGAQVNDFSQLLPFLMRTWMYLSGVLFSIQGLYEDGDVPGKVALLLQLNPIALYITLMRNALLESQRLSAPGSKPYNHVLCKEWVHYDPKTSPPSHLYYSAYCHPIGNPAHYWYFAIGWAVVTLVIGFFYFWRAEMKYGRG